ncbi:MAG TPA: proline iminopeptidase-family hydrolase, partial [Phnomibacter sp.]|nr:proline iminopeptidase-family hydrolase [Phnomibacter sp.]
MRFLTVAVSIAFLFGACNSSSNEATGLATYFGAAETGVKDGGIEMVPIETPAGSFKVWTKRFGNNPRIKVLLLHGGPGGTHEAFESFESFLPKEGIEFIYYDQLDSYRSSQPGDSSLWTTDRFVDEVEQVRKALGLTKDNFFLLGHSWGGILAMEYALQHQDQLKGLIISNMMSDVPAYGKYAQEVLGPQMPADVLAEIKAIEARGDFANPRYMALLDEHFYPKHVCRTDELPEPVARMFKHLNPSIYVTMQGPSEFGVSGRLVNWSRAADLPKINVPTLVIGAEHDTMDPNHMRWMAEQLPQGRSLICPNGSHCSMWDDQDN